MAEKKKGFFQRLFGGGDQRPPEAEAPRTAQRDEAPEHSVAEDLEADIVLDEVVDAAPLVLPPDQELALAEALHEAGETISPHPASPEAAEPSVTHEPAAGPPEATPAYIERAERAAPPEEPQPKKLNWFQRLATGLKRSSDQLTTSITSVFTKKKLDAEMLEDLEDILIQSDFGLEMASQVTETLRRERFDRDVSAEEVREVLAAEIVKVLEPVARPLEIDTGKTPYVILMIGVNGSGKTTTIGKLSSLYASQGKKVMLAAGDTFRAAAIEQLQVWGQRTGAPVVAKPAGSDASGLAYEAVERARAEGTDVLIIDTAGRLQNRDELMSELEKIIRVIKKVDPDAPHATLLTLDATTGQNALNQVEIFGKRAGVTGIVMTKLDGTARGGILVAIAQKFGLPVHFIGVGEGVDNLEPFAARDFAEAIAGKNV
jgi:fused signal recognition particle receptor